MSAVCPELLLICASPPELNNTEAAHREAMIELDRMKDEMDEMERERSQMIAEVEAQIERALVSMAFSDNMSDAGLSEGGTSRPGSALSSRPSSRPGSSNGGVIPGAHLRSFGTATTLAVDDHLVDSHPYGEENGPGLGSPTKMTTVAEVDEMPEHNHHHHRQHQEGSQQLQPLSEGNIRRWSATKTRDRESHTDGLNAIDSGITERSDAVAQKMLQIQQKVCQLSMLLSFLVVYLLHSS